MGNFHSYRNGSKRDEDDEVEDDQSIDQIHEVEVASPPPIGNWADELSDGPTPDTSPKKNPLDTEVRDLREKLNSMKMAGNNRPNGENQNQRFQKPRHGDRQNGQGDRYNGFGDRQNGHGDRYNGQGDRHNGQGDRYNGFGDRQNGHGDRYNGQGDRHNGHGDQKFN